jgi:thiamine pyrophosphokinase
MRCLVILAGSILDDQAARSWLETADRIVCADGGARHLHRLGFRPDLLVGDLDSISPADLAWLEKQNVPVRRYPAEKNETDSELAVQAALANLPEPPGQHEVIILGAFGSRPDHVLANQMLAAKLAGEGWRLVLSDGRSSAYTLAGGQSLALELPDADGQLLAISVIPLTAEISGLTYQGLAYPLTNATLRLGSTRGLSNRLAASPAIATLAAGILLLIVTPEE